MKATLTKRSHEEEYRTPNVEGEERKRLCVEMLEFIASVFHAFLSFFFDIRYSVFDIRYCLLSAFSCL